MALDVLASMTGGKKFVITPGMIELGEKQYEYNKRLGEKIAGSVDEAIIVGQYNHDAIMDGLLAGNMEPTRIHAVATFTDAYTLLTKMAGSGDYVLLENDLPDTFK